VSRLRIAPEELEDLPAVELRLLQRRVGRGRDQGDDDPLVLLRRQLVLRTDEEKIVAPEDDNGKNERRRQIAEDAAEHLCIALADLLEAVVDEHLETVVDALAGPLEEARAHHRRERQCDHGRDGDRAGEGIGEFLEKRAREAAHETDRNIDGDQHHRDGDDRLRQFPGALDRRVQRRQAAFHVAVRVLDDDDRVVDDESDREHQGEQRQQVDRVPEDEHDEEGPDERQRHGDRRDDHRTEGGQEKEDHQRDDDQRLHQRLAHLPDRTVHVLCGIVDDPPLQPLGQLRFDRREGLAHAVDHREEIRAGSHPDADIGGAVPVEGDRHVVVFGAEQDIGHISQPDDGAVFRFDDEVAELVGRMERRIGLQVHGDHLTLGPPDGGDIVVVGQRRPHIRAGQAVGAHLLGIEPRAQRETPRPEDFRGLHAFDGLQLRLHRPDQVVGDPVARHDLAVESDVHRHDRFADRDRDDGLLGIRRKLVQDGIDLGVDLRKGAVRIVVEAEKGLDDARILRAGGDEIIDSIGLGDGVLQRRRDEAGDDGRIGARIDGCHRHHGVLGEGEFAHRQEFDGADPQDDDEQVDHDGQDGAPYEEIGEMHRVSLRLTGPPAWGRRRLQAEPCCR